MSGGSERDKGKRAVGGKTRHRWREGSRETDDRGGLREGRTIRRTKRGERVE